MSDAETWDHLALPAEEKEWNMKDSSSLDKMVLKKSNKNHCEKNYDWMLGPSDCSAWLSLCWAFMGRWHEQLLVR